MLNVKPPGGDSWQAHILWDSIIRVCYKTSYFIESDDIYIFTKERDESYSIPIDSSGGYELWQEVLRKDLFDTEEAIELAPTSGELRCDPPT